ncbi:MAG TPA: VWA domain-containing protein [Chloroflexota bacterium]
MYFANPLALGGLVVLPVLVALHWWLGRRAGPHAIVLSSLQLIQTVPTLGWRRHVPPLMLVAALALLIVAGARPVAHATTPVRDLTVVIALDISGSMAAQDLEPSRLAAAQAAADALVARAPPGARLGLVTFSDTAQLVVPPTESHSIVRQALRSLQPQGATAIGDGLVAAMEAIVGAEATRSSLERATGGASIPTPPGQSAAVLLLTDGQANQGVSVSTATAAAAMVGVPVYTVGVGTTEGTVVTEGGEPVAAGFDEDSLLEIARTTGGRYFAAPSRQELERVFAEVIGTTGWREEQVEVSYLMAALAIPLLLGAVTLSHLWIQRFP